LYITRTCANKFDLCKMASKYTQWRRNETRFLSMTGYSFVCFDALLPFFKGAHDAYFERHDLYGKRRKGGRRFVIYKNSPLPTHEDRLAFILYIHKHNPVQELAADHFEMDQGQCNDYIHALLPIVEQALVNLGSMPCRRDEELQEALEHLEDKNLIHDGTEREVPRPQDDDEQRDKYSGKKKRHTIKNAVICTMVGFVIFLSPSVSGRIHDKTLADTYTILSGLILWQDTGYQGYKPKGVTIVQPTKKPRGRELSDEEKKRNQEISRIRVRIEHAIGGIKRYRVVKDECRMYKNGFRDRAMFVCTGLHNLRVTMIQPQYADFQAF
jgi:DDE superfamily endonuclease